MKGSGRVISCTGVPLALMIHTFTDEVYSAIIEITAAADGRIDADEVAAQLQKRGMHVSPRVVEQCMEMLDYDPGAE